MSKEGSDNSFGISSVNMGILSVLFSIIPIFGLILGVIGIIFGIIQGKRTKNKWALAGIILNIIGITLSILFYIASFYILSNWGSISPSSINS